MATPRSSLICGPVEGASGALVTSSPSSQALNVVVSRKRALRSSNNPDDSYEHFEQWIKSGCDAGQLRQLCQKRSLSEAGQKEDLIARLLAFERSPYLQPTPGLDGLDSKKKTKKTPAGDAKAVHDEKEAAEEEECERDEDRPLAALQLIRLKERPFLAGDEGGDLLGDGGGRDSPPFAQSFFRPPPSSFSSDWLGQLSGNQLKAVLHKLTGQHKWSSNTNNTKSQLTAAIFRFEPTSSTSKEALQLALSLLPPGSSTSIVSTSSSFASSSSSSSSSFSSSSSSASSSLQSRPSPTPLNFVSPPQSSRQGGREDSALVRRALRVDDLNRKTISSAAQGNDPNRAKVVASALHAYFNRLEMSPTGVQSCELMLTGVPMLQRPIQSDGGDDSSASPPLLAHIPIPPLPIALSIACSDILQRWRSSLLKVGDGVDATEDDIRDPTLPHLLKWFSGTVVEVTKIRAVGGYDATAFVADKTGTLEIPGGQRGLKITFTGFSVKHDRWFASGDDAVMPVSTERTALWLWKKARKGGGGREGEGEEGRTTTENEHGGGGGKHATVVGARPPPQEPHKGGGGEGRGRRA